MNLKSLLFKLGMVLLALLFLVILQELADPDSREGESAHPALGSEPQVITDDTVKITNPLGAKSSQGVCGFFHCF